MKKQILASESFSSGKRHYFLDFKRANNNSKYLQFTRSEQQADGSFKRFSFLVFQNHFEQFITAFSSLFRNVAYMDQDNTTVQQIYEEVKQNNGIKSIPEEERPREKLMAMGANTLSHAELLAILIGSGSPNESATELAGRIMDCFDGKLHRLRGLKVQELFPFKGMGIAKSCSVVAALELARRIYDCPPPQFRTIYLAYKPGNDPSGRSKDLS